MSFECPQLNDTDNKKNEFHVKCGPDIFAPFRPIFDHIENKYLNYINNIDDPTLKYVSVYLVQYYKDGYKYFGNSDPTHKREACTYLIKWLLEKKDLFTYGGKCKTKMYLWENKIDPLWKRLISDYKPLIKDKNAWCYDYPISFSTTFPSEVNLPNCDEIISEKSSSQVILPLTTEKDCNCPQNVVSENLPQIDESPDIQPTRKIAFTSGLTTAGTVGTLLLLYKYTPVSSWFRRRGMHNVGTDLYMNPGSPGGFLRMQGENAPLFPDNGSNNIFYHSTV